MLYHKHNNNNNNNYYYYYSYDSNNNSNNSNNKIIQTFIRCTVCWQSLLNRMCQLLLGGQRYLCMDTGQIFKNVIFTQCLKVVGESLVSSSNLPTNRLKIFYHVWWRTLDGREGVN